MKIFLPFQTKDIGGTTTFAKKFQEGMKKRGHDVFFEYRPDYDILFCIVQAPFKYLTEARRCGKKVVQRLDGVHYWSIQGYKYPLLNLKAKIIRHLFTDFTVYQSMYSKYSAEKFLGKKSVDPSTIIYNGVDLSLFSPEGERVRLRDNSNQKIFFTASAFRRENQIIPIIEALKVYQSSYNSNFKFYVAGTFTNDVSGIPGRYRDFKNIVFLGKINNVDLPKYERSADVFLFTHSNPPCPNNVIEAMACGLPICGVADGAMPELVEERKNALLIPSSGDAFWKNRSYDVDTFAENINSIIRNREQFSRESIGIACERFSLKAMIDNYERVFKNFLK